MQRKVVSPNDFTDLAEVEARLLDFQNRYNATATPYAWKFTTSNLRDLLARIDAHHHEPHDTTARNAAPAIPQAA